MVFVFIQVTNVPASAWTNVATDLPLPIDNIYFTGLNAASNSDVSLVINNSGVIQMYGRGSITSCTTGIVYMANTSA